MDPIKSRHKDTLIEFDPDIIDLRVLFPHAGDELTFSCSYLDMDRVVVPKHFIPFPFSYPGLRHYICGCSLIFSEAHGL